MRSQTSSSFSTRRGPSHQLERADVSSLALRSISALPICLSTLHFHEFGLSRFLCPLCLAQLGGRVARVLWRRILAQICSLCQSHVLLPFPRMPYVWCLRDRSSRTFQGRIWRNEGRGVIHPRIGALTKAASGCFLVGILWKQLENAVFSLTLELERRGLVQNVISPRRSFF